MMLKPSMTDLATRGERYYSVVVGIAKRARQISDEQLEKKKEESKRPELVEKLKDEHRYEGKPVNLAVEEYKAKKFSILQDHSGMFRA